MDAEAIVRALAALDEPFSEYDEWMQCVLCGRIPDGREGFPHAPSCPYRAAREWVAEHYDGPTTVRAIPPAEQRATLTIDGHAATPGPLELKVDDKIVWGGMTWRIESFKPDGTLECVRDDAQ